MPMLYYRLIGEYILTNSLKINYLNAVLFLFPLYKKLNIFIASNTPYIRLLFKIFKFLYNKIILHCADEYSIISKNFLPVKFASDNSLIYTLCRVSGGKKGYDTSKQHSLYLLNVY
jgi:hypothetical protein